MYAPAAIPLRRLTLHLKIFIREIFLSNSFLSQLTNVNHAKQHRRVDDVTVLQVIEMMLEMMYAIKIQEVKHSFFRVINTVTHVKN